MCRGQVWEVQIGHSCLAPINQQEDKHNQFFIYPQTAQPKMLQVFTSGLYAALNNIPPLGFIVLSFSSWITQNNPVCQPPLTIVSVHKPQIFSCPPWDGRNTHASVIQYQCQSHFEDSYEQAGRRAIKWWSSLHQVSTDSAALKQRQQTGKKWIKLELIWACYN